MSIPDWTISVYELRDSLGKVCLLDVREPEEHEESRLEGCKLIPLGELQSRATAELDPEAEIVIYCAHGMRSMQALMGLRRMGFMKTRSLEGGISAWEGMDLPVQK